MYDTHTSGLAGTQGRDAAPPPPNNIDFIKALFAQTTEQSIYICSFPNDATTRRSRVSAI